MTVTQTTRLELYRWSADGDEFTRTQMDVSHQKMENLAAKLESGTTLPDVAQAGIASAYDRSFFFDTANDKLYFFDDGHASATWHEVTLDPTINKSVFTAAGQLMYSTASSTPAVLNAGTAGYFLTTNGSNAVSWAEAVTPTASQTLTNKTLTSPTINAGALNRTVLGAPFEKWTYSASAISGVTAFDIANNSSAFLYAGSHTASWTPNFRFNSGTTLDSQMSVGDSLTVSIASNIGSSAGFSSTLQIDGSSQTIRWQGALAPTSGNAGTYDVYSYAVIKTASNTFIVFASRTKFGT